MTLKRSYIILLLTIGFFRFIQIIKLCFELFKVLLILFVKYNLFLKSFKVTQFFFVWFVELVNKIVLEYDFSFMYFGLMRVIRVRVIHLHGFLKFLFFLFLRILVSFCQLYVNFELELLEETQINEFFVLISLQLTFISLLLDGGCPLCFLQLYSF